MSHERSDRKVLSAGSSKAGNGRLSATSKSSNKTNMAGHGGGSTLGGGAGLDAGSALINTSREPINTASNMGLLDRVSGTGPPSKHNSQGLGAHNLPFLQDGHGNTNHHHGIGMASSGGTDTRAGSIDAKTDLHVGNTSTAGRPRSGLPPTTRVLQNDTSTTFEPSSNTHATAGTGHAVSGHGVVVAAAAPPTVTQSAPVPHEKHKYIGNYEILKTIGEGSFAKVKLAIHRLTNQKVAIKVIDKEKLPDEYSLKNIHREAQIMRLLDHPNIIQLYEVMETKKELFLVLEYAPGGEVLDFIVSQGRLKEKDARRFCKQIVSAIEYCHNLNIVHRDLKAENLLIGEDNMIKISDFGLSNTFDRSQNLTTCCGSPVYSAPELIEGKKYIGPEVDAWSLGINLYAMVVGDLPFADSNITALYESILKGKYNIPDYLSTDCQDLISKLLVINPKKRFTLSQVHDHPWMTMGILENTSTANSRLQAQPETATNPSKSTSHLIFNSQTPTTANSTGVTQNGPTAASSNSSNPLIPYLRPKTLEQIDPEIMEQLECMGFEAKAASAAIIGGKFNQAAGTYYLLSSQKRHDIMKFMKDAEARKSSNSEKGHTGPGREAGGGLRLGEDLETMNRRIVEEREKSGAHSGETSDTLARVMISWERKKSGLAEVDWDGMEGAGAVVGGFGGGGLLSGEAGTNQGPAGGGFGNMTGEKGGGNGFAAGKTHGTGGGGGGGAGGAGAGGPVAGRRARRSEIESAPTTTIAVPLIYEGSMGAKDSDGGFAAIGIISNNANGTNMANMASGHDVPNGNSVSSKRESVFSASPNVGIIGPGLVPIDINNTVGREKSRNNVHIEQVLAHQQAAVLVPNTPPENGSPPSASSNNVLKHGGLTDMLQGTKEKRSPITGRRKMTETAGSIQVSGNTPSSIGAGPRTSTTNPGYPSTLSSSIDPTSYAGMGKPMHTQLMDGSSAGGLLVAGDTAVGLNAISGNNTSTPSAEKSPKSGGGRRRTTAAKTSIVLDPSLYLEPSQDVDNSGVSMLDPAYPNLRTIRFAFNCSTTTSTPPDDLMDRLKRVLAKNDVTYHAEYFMMECDWGDIKFELEVCKLPRLKNMYGLRFKRVNGDMWDFKRLSGKIVAEMEL